MLVRFRSSCLAWVVAVLLVFSQLVVAAYACAEALPPTQTVAAVADDMGDCVDHQKMERPVVCKAHCEIGSQSSDVRLPQLTAPLFIALFFINPYPETPDAVILPPRAAPPTLIAASPPLRIQYQVFRN